MSKIKPELEQQLHQQPDETFDLIVRTAGEATPHLAWLAANEVQVKQQYRLSPGAISNLAIKASRSRSGRSRMAPPCAPTWPSGAAGAMVPDHPQRCYDRLGGGQERRPGEGIDERRR